MQEYLLELLEESRYIVMRRDIKQSGLDWSFISNLDLKRCYHLPVWVYIYVNWAWLPRWIHPFQPRSRQQGTRTAAGWPCTVSIVTLQVSVAPPETFTVRATDFMRCVSSSSACPQTGHPVTDTGSLLSVKVYSEITALSELSHILSWRDSSILTVNILAVNNTDVYLYQNFSSCFLW